MSGMTRFYDGPCEVVVGHFAWFSQTCNQPAVKAIVCEDDRCESRQHFHSICAEHSASVTADNETGPTLAQTAGKDPSNKAEGEKQ